MGQQSEVWWKTDFLENPIPNYSIELGYSEGMSWSRVYKHSIQTMGSLERGLGACQEQWDAKLCTQKLKSEEIRIYPMDRGTDQYLLTWSQPSMDKWGNCTQDGWDQEDPCGTMRSMMIEPYQPYVGLLNKLTSLKPLLRRQHDAVSLSKLLFIEPVGPKEAVYPIICSAVYPFYIKHLIS